MRLTLLGVLVICLTICGVSAELVAVVQVFRHGQRTPINAYANDPYKDKSYWAGLDDGQLTNEGKRQHYALGQFTRKRYSTFLPDKYSRFDFYAQTTDIDRTHMSAQANIYGLFPATQNDQKWQKNSNWQPIPIHPSDNDVWSYYFYPPSCKKYATQLANYLNSEEYQKINSNYTAVYDYISINSGQEITTYADISQIWDPLKIEHQVGFSLPSWSSSVFPEPLYILTGYYFEMYTHTDAMKRLVIGPFLNELVTYLEQMADDPSSQQKFRMYSGHDSNLVSILNTFGAYDPPFPLEFTSSIYFELHLESWRHLVKVFLKSGNDVKEIDVNGCGSSCTLENFRNSLSDYIVDVPTRDQECEEEVNDTSSSRSPLLQQFGVYNNGLYTEDYVRQKFQYLIN